MKLFTPLALLLAAFPAAAAPATRYIVALRPVESRPAVRVFGDEAAVARHAARDLDIVNGFAADLSPAEVVALRRSKNVRYVDPVVERRISEDGPVPLAKSQTVPYGIDLVRTREVWKVSRGANVNIAVIDTGIAANHPDLAANVAGGYNAQSHNANFADDQGHGTHVAGTIAALDNGVGVVGVAPQARIWSVKALDAQGNGTTEDVVAAAAWVLAKKKDVGGNWIVSMSFGSGAASAAEDEAFRQLRDADVLCIAASGNNGFLALDYPAAYASVLSVGAVDATRTAASFSNGGGTLGVMAPGVAVLSTALPGSTPNSAAQRGGARIGGVPFRQSGRGEVSGGLADCGYGGAGECGDAAGKIALIARGNGLYFADKVHNAIASGAIGAVIVNYDDSPLFTASLAEGASWPPVTLVTKSDGAALAQQAGPITLGVWDDDYAVKSGTSMATPHVAGVAALLWSLAPGAHAIDIRRAIELTAHDLGPGGFDAANGNGLVDAAAAAKALAPAAFGLPAAPLPEPPRRRSAGH